MMREVFCGLLWTMDQILFRSKVWHLLHYLTVRFHELQYLYPNVAVGLVLTLLLTRVEGNRPPSPIYILKVVLELQD